MEECCYRITRGDPNCQVLVPSRLFVYLLLELTVALLSGEREVGTEGKILLLAREDKKLQGVGLQSRQPVRSLKLSEVFTWEGAPRCCYKISSEASLLSLPFPRFVSCHSHGYAEHWAEELSQVKTNLDG